MLFRNKQAFQQCKIYCQEALLIKRNKHKFPYFLCFLRAAPCTCSVLLRTSDFDVLIFAFFCLFCFILVVIWCFFLFYLLFNCLDHIFKFWPPLRVSQIFCHSVSPQSLIALPLMSSCVLWDQIKIKIPFSCASSLCSCIVIGCVWRTGISLPVLLR